MPALPKLTLGPNSRPLLPSTSLISNCGKSVAPRRFIPKVPGENCCSVCEQACNRVKPACGCHVRLGLRITVLLIAPTWLPAESCCGKPSSAPTAPNGLVVARSEEHTSE